MNHPIVIMGAMEDVELNVLKANMKIVNEFHENKYTFYEGQLASTDVVLVSTQVGFVNASVATILAIQKYQPAMIISTRNCGRIWK